nr:hypothetical protein GCM10020063_037940 [Dactylosporangium thailandense]
MPASVREWYSLAAGQEIRLLPFMIENQGVCFWAVMLDGSDDPPVMISLDDLEPSDEWTMLAATFSDLVYTRIWDHQAMCGVRTLRAPVASFDPATVRASTGLATQLSTSWGDETLERIGHRPAA